MWINSFFILSTIETAVIIWVTLLNQSAPQESILWGYSLEKLLLLLALFIFFLFFAVLAYFSFKKKSRIYQRLHQTLSSEKLLWFVLWTCVLFVILIFFLFIQPQEWFGSYLNFFDHLKAVLFWLLVLCIQTVFFLIIGYAVHFIEQPQEKIPALSIKELKAVSLIFLAAILLKLIFVLPNTYGLYKDVGESKYFNMIYYLYDGRFLHSADDVTTHYPFLYPLLLLFTYSVKNYTFQCILVINAIFASSIVFPLYFLSRRFLNKHYSLILMVIASLIPFQFLIPNRIMSENLYFPLLLWSIYLAFVSPKNPKYRFIWDCLTGFSFGLLYLTRFISLAIIPFLIVIWWLKPFSGTKGILRVSSKKALHALIMLLITALVYSPWVVIGLDNDLTLAQTLGFGITANTNLQQLTFQNLLQWILLYGAYFILLAAPVLNLIMIAFRSFRSKPLKHEGKRWLVSLLVLLLAFTLAVVRHSWRAYYNLEQPEKIMGRYVIYFVPLFLMTGFMGLKEFQKSGYQSSGRFFCSSVLLPAVLVGFSYALVIAGKLISIGKGFIQPLISIDGFYIQQLGSYFFVFILLLYFGTAYFLWNGRKKAVEFAGWVLLAYYLFAIPDCLGYLDSQSTFQKLGYQVSEMMLSAQEDREGTLDYKIYLSDGFYVDDRKDFAWSLYVRNLDCDWEIIKYPADEKPDLENELGFIIYPYDEADPASFTGYPVMEIGGTKFVVERELGSGMDFDFGK